MEQANVLSQPQWQSLDSLRLSSSIEEQKLLDKLHRLLTVDSLTQGLESIDPNFSVEIISLTETNEYDSNELLNPIHLCRKVALLLSGKAMIYAESHCDIAAIASREFLLCGNHSLGRKLFTLESPLERSLFSYAFFSFEDLPLWVQKQYPSQKMRICARRSYFLIEGEALFITEWYLPELLKKRAVLSF